MQCAEHNSELVTADRVAVVYGVSVGTVNRWVRSARIPCVRVSRRTVRFRLKDVERALTRAAQVRP